MRLGVVLFQLGGPDNLEAIEPFLFNLFSDPDIIDFPFARIGRKPLARLIASTRAKKVRHHYQEIGGGSPIRRFTEQQARALEAELHIVGPGTDVCCVVAMRYWHPFTQEAIAQLDAFAPDEIVLLPMYPQYSSTTTGSSLNEWQRQINCGTAEVPNCRIVEPQSGTLGIRQLRDVPQHIIEHFYRDELYLRALAERIETTLERFRDPATVELVFSAHSVPLAVIERGDPYQRQMEETVALVMQRGRWPNRHRLCYQSKVGASRWLQPSLRATIRDLGTAGVKQVCVAPLSFVSDHVETLGEIDHEARALAQKVGIQRFEMVPGLNDSPTFIAALAGLVLRAAGIRPAAREVAAD